MQIDARFADFLAIYRAELLEQTIPFWLKQAIDWEHGGILTCISDEGQVLSGDKYMWSQLRAIWTFSALYNTIESRPEWLDVARHIFQFVKRYGRTHDYAFCHYPVPIYGEWTQKLDRRGEKFTQTVALPVKDPFHLPRSLILCVGILERLAAGFLPRENAN